jgi:NAD(P)-dependent dehydrogenase (short-subunit alcohol dehydrogenase family)
MKQTALVTGSRRGIGKAIAVSLAEAQFDVAINDIAASPELEETVDHVRKLGGRAVAVIGDLGDLSQHERMLSEAEAALGPLTSLVNNAGVSVLNRGDLLDVTPESYDRCLAINTRGTFFLTQAFAKRLLKRERPAALHHSVVTISSANAIGVSINRGEYCISKAGLSMASKLFAARLSNEGIGVYEVQPGFIETDMTAPSKERYDKLIAQGLTVIQRFGRPDEVARIVTTLATGGLPYTCGQAIAADAGLLTVRY